MFQIKYVWANDLAWRLSCHEKAAVIFRDLVVGMEGAITQMRAVSEDEPDERTAGY